MSWEYNTQHSDTHSRSDGHSEAQQAQQAHQWVAIGTEKGKEGRSEGVHGNRPEESIALVFCPGLCYNRAPVGISDAQLHCYCCCNGELPSLVEQDEPSSRGQSSTNLGVALPKAPAAGMASQLRSITPEAEDANNNTTTGTSTSQ